jgi:hypothetical protein
MANPRTKSDGPAIEEVERFLQATQGEDPSARAAMAQALTARNRAADTLWRWVVIGLMVLSALALAGLLYLVADGNPETQPDLVLTAFVGLLGGLMGLLIGAPWQGQSSTE